MIKEYEKGDLDSLSRTTVIDFYAEWCGPCKAMKPVLQELDEDMPDVDVLKIDIDENQKVAREHGIRAVPTFKLYHEGRIQSLGQGFQNDLNDKIRELVEA
jgi:thioredoxin 1